MVIPRHRNDFQEKQHNDLNRPDPQQRESLRYGHAADALCPWLRWDQNMWRFVAQAFESTTIGSFCSITSARANRTCAPYHPQRYGALPGYARDVLEIVPRPGLRGT